MLEAISNMIKNIEHRERYSRRFRVHLFHLNSLEVAHRTSSASLP